MKWTKYLKMAECADLKPRELEMWQRNRHLIWLFAIAGSICTFMIMQAYNSLQTSKLQGNLADSQRIVRCLYTSDCKQQIESLDINSKAAEISQIAAKYYNKAAGK